MKTRVLLFILICVALSFGLCACSSEAEADGNNTVIAGSEVTVPTVTWPLSESQIADVQPINDFSLRLTQHLWREGDSSMVVSPLSLAIALSMVNEGAVGQTRDEITTVLGFEAGQYKKMTDLCASLLKGMSVSNDSLTLEVANACCVNQRFGLYKEYQDVMEDSYQALVSALDFSSGEAVAGRINAWCNEKTHGLIPRIVTATDIDADLAVLWLNSIYYKGLWNIPFNKENTADGVFHGLNGQQSETVRLPMMHLTTKMPYMHTDDFAAVEMSACGGRFAMTAVLPHNTYGLYALLNSMNSQQIAAIQSQMNDVEVDLTLPRFSVESSFSDSLKVALQSMGMQRLFTQSAQITNVSPGPGLSVSLIRQKARIDVTEEGAKAAAVTIIGGKQTESGVSKTFSANRPFLYYLTDRMTGLITFIGIFNAQKH